MSLHDVPLELTCVEPEAGAPGSNRESPGTGSSPNHRRGLVAFEGPTRHTEERLGRRRTHRDLRSCRASVSTVAQHDSLVVSAVAD